MTRENVKTKRFHDDDGIVEVGDDAPTATRGVLWLDTSATGSPSTGLLTTTTIAVNTILTTSHTVVLCDASSAPITVTLPVAAGSNTRRYFIKKIDSSGNAVTVDANGSETIDGSTTQIIVSQYDCIEIVCDGTEWWII